MGALNTFWRKFDLFSVNAGVYLAGEDKYTTSFGGIFSIIFVAFMGFYAYTSITPMINKTDPAVTMALNFSRDPSEIHLNNTNFFVGLKIVYYNDDDFQIMAPWNYSLFSLVATNIASDQNEDVFTDMGMGPCDADAIKAAMSDSDIYEDYEMMDYWCPTNLDAKIGGRPLGNSFSTLSIQFQDCYNDTNPNITCFSDDTIWDIMDNYDIEAYVVYLNRYADTQDYNDPMHTYLDYTGGLVTTDFAVQNIDIYLDQLTLSSDDGALWSTPNVTDTFLVNPQFESTTLSEVPKSSTTPFSYLTVNIKRSNYQQVYTRNYLKLADFMSALGGFGGSIIGICAFFVASYAGIKYQLFIANSLYRFKKEPPKNMKPLEGDGAKNSADANNTTLEVPLVSERNKVVDLSFKDLGEENNVKGSDRTGKLLLSNIYPAFATTKRIALNFFEFMGYSYFGYKKSDKGKLVTKAIDKAIDESDLLNIAKKLREIEMLKKLLLTKEQIQVFNAVPKDYIDNEEEEEVDPKGKELFDKSIDKSDIVLKLIDYEEIDKYISLFKAYEKLTIEAVDNKTNSLLLEMMDKEMLASFEDIRSNLSPDYSEEDLHKVIAASLKKARDIMKKKK